MTRLAALYMSRSEITLPAPFDVHGRVISIFDYGAHNAHRCASGRIGGSGSRRVRLPALTSAMRGSGDGGHGDAAWTMDRNSACKKPRQQPGLLSQLWPASAPIGAGLASLTGQKEKVCVGVPPGPTVIESNGVRVLTTCAVNEPTPTAAWASAPARSERLQGDGNRKSVHR
jgi:hypothetical protein